MAFLCKVFGHSVPSGYGSSPPYRNVRLLGVDGIDRQHAAIDAECANCGEKFTVAMIHVPQRRYRDLDKDDLALSLAKDRPDAG